MSGSHFVYKLMPPRPTFAADMSAAEHAIMGQHAAYWTNLFQEGSVVVFGVVMDQAGTWGLAVVEAEDEDVVRAIAADDPAVKGGLCTFDIGVMPGPSVRPRPTATQRSVPSVGDRSTRPAPSTSGRRRQPAGHL